jgi:putative addiction module component (TIGR02574 family)
MLRASWRARRRDESEVYSFPLSTISSEGPSPFRAKKNGELMRNRYPEGMTASEVKALPLPAKIELMEALWVDLRERFERMELSEDQKALLDGRRAAVESGKSRLHDWDAVKSAIGRG